MKRISLLFLYLLFLGLYGSILYAQQPASPDHLFKQARDAAFKDENYPKAIKLAKKGLQLAPEYTDLRLFLGRVYFWNDEHAMARVTLKKILAKHPTQTEARIVLIDVELETKNYTRALALAKEGLDDHSTNTELLFRKGKALEQLDRIDAAIRQYRYVLKFDPGFPYVNDLITRLKGEKRSWETRVGYTYDWFDTTFDPWQMGRFELQRNSSVGNIIARVQYGQRFSNNDFQVELDAYPIISRTMYAYTNIGVSDNTFFPSYRLGLSLYRTLPKSYEVSAGLRYLHFDNPNLLIYTASLGKYLYNYRVSLQTFYTPKLEGNTLSANLLIRRYLGDPDSFVELRVGGGSSASGFESQQDINRLGTVNTSIELQQLLSTNWYIRGHVGYSREEYTIDAIRNRWTTTLGLSFKF